MEGVPMEEYDACTKLLEEYKKCSDEYPILKYVGFCEKKHVALNRCMKHLYELETAIRKEKGRKLKERIHENMEKNRKKPTVNQ